MFTCQQKVGSSASWTTENTKKATIETCWTQPKSCVPLSHFDKECKDDSKTLKMMMWIKLQLEDNVPLVSETIIPLKFYSTSISSICGGFHWRE